MSLSVHDVPLRQVIDDLRDDLGINIFVDEPALAEPGISLDTPITLKVENIAYKSALRLLLDSVHLTYVIKDDVLKITTQEAEDRVRNTLVLRVYEVSDLLPHSDLWTKCVPSPKDQPSETLLSEIITTTVYPNSWASVGGSGTIDYSPKEQALVINQTLIVHDEIVDLLHKLRKLSVQDEDKQACSEPKVNPCNTEPGIEPMVCGLMKACHLLMSQGMQHQAAELARQAYALDPQRVMADPLIYKMHLLAESLETPVGSERRERAADVSLLPQHRQTDPRDRAGKEEQRGRSHHAGRAAAAADRL